MKRQIEKLINYFKTNETITRKEAMEKLGIQDVSSCVSDCREQGYKIKAERNGAREDGRMVTRWVFLGEGKNLTPLEKCGEEITKYLQTHESATADDMADLFGKKREYCMMAICKLRKKGVKIRTGYIEDPTGRHNSPIAKYSLEKGKEKAKKEITKAPKEDSLFSLFDEKKEKKTSAKSSTTRFDGMSFASRMKERKMRDKYVFIPQSNSEQDAKLYTVTSQDANKLSDVETIQKGLEFWRVPLTATLMNDANRQIDMISTDGKWGLRWFAGTGTVCAARRIKNGQITRVHESRELLPVEEQKFGRMYKIERAEDVVSYIVLNRSRIQQMSEKYSKTKKED